MTSNPLTELLFGAAVLSIKRAGMIASLVLMLFLLTGGYYVQVFILVCLSDTQSWNLIKHFSQTNRILCFHCSTYQNLCSGWSTYRSCTTGSDFYWKFNIPETNYTSVKAKEDAGHCRARLHLTWWTWVVACKKYGFYWLWRLVTAFVLTYAYERELVNAIFDQMIPSWQ